MAIGLGDLISSVGSVFNGGEGNPDNNPISMNAAAEAYGLTGFIKEGGIQRLNIPKLQYAYLIQFVMSTEAIEFLQRKYPTIATNSLSYLVKDADLPSQVYETFTVNQYNRVRKYTGKVTYNPVNLAIYDTVDSSALKVYDAYRAWYNADFHNKRLGNWAYNQVSQTDDFEDDWDEYIFEGDTYQDVAQKTWGRSVLNQGSLDQSYFFKRIDIIEIQDGVFTYHNIHNPIISTANFETKSHESDGAPALINLTFEYEGISHVNPLLGGRYDPLAISRPATEIVDQLGSTILGADRYHRRLQNLPLEDEPNENSSIFDSFGSTAEAVLGTIGGVTEGISGDEFQESLSNIGNIAKAGTSATNDATGGASSLGGIGGSL